jgi:hypothetical protein
MYRWLLITHSAWRWVVVVAGLMALLRAAAILSAGKDWNPNGARLLRLFSISLDIQVLMGAALYLSVSPLTTVVPSTTGERLPADSQAYYFTVIHPIIMVAAFIAVHIAGVLVRRGRSDVARARRALIFCGLAWLLVLAGIPWWRPWMRM